VSSRTESPAAAPRRVLIVSLRYLGDLLISTLMADGVKQRWPGCTVDYLVYEGMEGVLQGNGCVDGVLTLPPRAAQGPAGDVAAGLAAIRPGAHLAFR